MSYLGQGYDPATPIRSDAYEVAKQREARWLAARYFIYNQQRQPDLINHTGIFRRIGPRSAWTPLNTHDAIHHGDMLVGRCMEFVRR